MKVIIAGSRIFEDYQFMSIMCDNILGVRDDIEIVSGGAKGADKLGERFAKERNLPLTIFHAEWDKYGKSAGYKRNVQMADYGDMLIAFWDGKSSGTKHMINLAEKKGMEVNVFNPFEIDY